LALALALYVEVEIVPAARLSLSSEGEGSTVACDEDHLAAKIARAVCGHDRLAISVRSEIPMRRGLGSSAALSVAAAAAAGAADPLKVAAGFEGHGENAAASLRGGLVSAALLDTGPVVRRFPLDPALSFVVLVPDRELATSEARTVLDDLVPRDDAVFNMSRMSLLLAGLADHTLLTGDASQDRLHQSQRSRLFPEAPELLARLDKAGALMSCWSGAGPSLLGVCDGALSAARVREAGEVALRAVAVPGRAIVVSPDLGGLVLAN
jgi:homoserine kinase